MLQRSQVLPFVREVEDPAAGGRIRPPSPGLQAAAAPTPDPRSGGGLRLEVDFLADPGDGRVLHFLDRLLRLVRRLEGAPLDTVVEALRRQERRVRDARRLSGLARTLLQGCRFEPPAGAFRAAEFRRALFAARGRRWPPLPGDEELPYREAAEELGLSGALRSDPGRLIYADHPGERVLRRAPRWDAATLLDRYNLELARGVLLDAESVTLRARGGWKELLRAVKLARVMYRLEPEHTRTRRRRQAYRLELTGPAAPFLAHPRRYGARFASVVPALVRAPSWSLEARIQREGRPATYRLAAGAPVGKGRRARYDSRWEAELARELRGAMAEGGGGRVARSDWTLHREATLVHLGDELLLPDFTLRHRDGREVLVELVGFWTPEYLEEKLRKLRRAGIPNLVLVVSRKLAAGGGEEAVEEAASAAGGEVVWFSGKVRARPVLEAAERVGRRGEA